MRLPKYMFEHWETLIPNVSTEKNKTYSYGFTDAVNRCGLESMKAFNK